MSPKHVESMAPLLNGTADSLNSLHKLQEERNSKPKGKYTVKWNRKEKGSVNFFENVTRNIENEEEKLLPSGTEFSSAAALPPNYDGCGWSSSSTIETETDDISLESSTCSSSTQDSDGNLITEAVVHDDFINKIQPSEDTCGLDTDASQTFSKLIYTNAVTQGPCSNGEKNRNKGSGDHADVSGVTLRNRAKKKLTSTKPRSDSLGVVYTKCFFQGQSQHGSDSKMNVENYCREMKKDLRKEISRQGEKLKVEHEQICHQMNEMRVAQYNATADLKQAVLDQGQTIALQGQQIDLQGHQIAYLSDLLHIVLQTQAKVM